MGLIVPNLSLDTPDGNIQMSNVYIAVGHFDINIRNYKPESVPDVPFFQSSNDEPVVHITQTGIIPGMSILINYGIWASKDSRLAKEQPVTLRTVQASFNPESSNIFTLVYDTLKTVFPEAQDEIPTPPEPSVPL